MGSQNESAMTIRQSDAVSNDYQGLEMVTSPAEALRRVQELQAFVAKVMVRDTDYGVIPGAGNKPALLQPGAQKLAEMYGFAYSFEDVAVIEDWDKPLFMYRKKCVLTSKRDGRFICDGIGSCNSREDRYAWRWVPENKLPQGTDKKLCKTRSTKYGTQYRLPNEDVFSLVNTIEKMACKRALVMAVIGATRSSGVFTQDVEDIPAEVFGQEDESRSWDKGQPKKAAPVADAEFVEGEPQQAAPAKPDAQAVAAGYELRIRNAKSLGELEPIGREIQKTNQLDRETKLKLSTTYQEVKASFAQPAQENGAAA
jgi:hypothetical protein